jgi:hypothetical protein
LISFIGIVGITLPQSVSSNSMPRIYPFSECTTVAEALPDLKIATKRPRTATAYYGNTAIVVRDQGNDGPLCERGCILSIIMPDDKLEQYALLSRKSALRRDQEYEGIAGTAVDRTLFLKMEGRQWLVLEISYLRSRDGDRTYRKLETGITEFPKSLTGSDMQTKIGSCLERP